MPSNTISRGNVLNEVVLAVTLTPQSVAANSTATQTFALPGILTTDLISSDMAPLTAAQTQNIVFVNCFVSQAGVVAYQVLNTSAAAITPVSGVYGCNVIRPENIPLPTSML